MRTRLLTALALALVLLLPRPAAADLLVASNDTHEVLRYDGATGAFIDVFVPAGSGGLDGPLNPLFGPDGNLYVGSLFGGGTLRYDGRTGEFLDIFAFFGATSPTFGPDGNFYVALASDNAVLRYDGTTPDVFLDTFVPAGSGGLDFPTSLTFTPESVPEPSSLMLFCVGLLGLGLTRRRAK